MRGFVGATVRLVGAGDTDGSTRRHLRSLVAVITGLTAGLAVALAAATAHASGGSSGGSELWVFGSSGTQDTGVQLLPGTSPSIAEQGDGYRVAYQSTGGDLASYSSGGDNPIYNLAMAPGTNPSIAALPNDDDAMVFQDSAQGVAYSAVSGNGAGHSIALGMANPSSPAVAAMSASSCEIAAQANTGTLWIGDPCANVNNINTGDGMAPDTSPGITAVANGTYVVVFQNGQGGTYVATITNHTANAATSIALGMNNPSSPAIASTSAGSCEIAAQANTGVLWTGDPCAGVGNGPAGGAMAPDTSPSIAALANGTYAVAYQNASGDLAILNNGITIDTGDPMTAGTSPAITAAPGGYEVAFSGPVPTAPATTTVVQTTPGTQTTPETQTTPAPGAGSTKPGSRASLKLRLAFSWTWSRTSTRLRTAALITKLSEKVKVRVRVTVKVRVNGKTETRRESRIRYRTVRVTVKIPRGTTASLRCTGKGCPRFGAAKPTRKGAPITLSDRLARADGHVFRTGNVLTITLSAPGHRSETITARMLNGREPRLGITR